MWSFDDIPTHILNLFLYFMNDPNPVHFLPALINTLFSTLPNVLVNVSTEFLI